MNYSADWEAANDLHNEIGEAAAEAERDASRDGDDDLTLRSTTGGEIGVVLMPDGAVRFTDYDSGWERWAVDLGEARRLADYLRGRLA
jgi:hypothetical protein